MKVIFATDAIKYPLTGIGRYTFELAKCLLQHSGKVEILFLRGGSLSTQIPLAAEHGSSAQKLTHYIKKSRFASGLYRLTVPWLKTLRLRCYPDAIYHGTNFYLPPKVERCVVTFHDLSVFTLPQYHPPERVRFMQKALLQTIRRAKIFITDSDFTRHELMNYFNLAADKVYSAKLACGAEFKPGSGTMIAALLRKYQLDFRHYTLFTGSIEPRKNIGTLLDAYQRLPIKIRRRIPLVMSGFRGWNSEKLHQRLSKGQREGWLRYLGFTPSSDLPALYAGARSFLFPSHYEGFGLPVLEAMASGTPVVCSNSSSLPEVVGDCALMCDAMNVDILTGLIRKSIDDELWRAQAIAAGLQRARQFSWQRCAQETLFAYQQVK